MTHAHHPKIIFSINAATVMQHPFTFIVAGCTQGGKINPPPQRIICYYSQWQQSFRYDENDAWDRV